MNMWQKGWRHSVLRAKALAVFGAVWVGGAMLAPNQHTERRNCFMNVDMKAVAVAVIMSVLGLLLVGQPAAAGERAREVRFKTYSPSSISAIFGGDWKTGEVEIAGRLELPEGNGPFPVVILYHGSGHARNLKSWFQDLIPALHQKGLAAFVMDSYTGRGIGQTASDQARLSKAARVVDAFRAFQTLSSMPEIDGARIGITGYSFGGIVSLVTADRRTAKGILGSEDGFAAHLPVYPSCQAQFRVSHFTDAPILILAGGRDDYTPAKYCEDYVARLRSEGINVDLKVYPDARHGWIKGSQGVKTCKKCMTFGACGPIVIDDDGHETALAGKVSTRDGWKSYITKVAKACAKRGTTTGLNVEARRDTLLTTVEFFSTNL